MFQMKNLGILFINPGNSRKRVYQTLSENYSAIEPPFWAALTAGFIRKKGFSTEILDANVENLTMEETAERVEEYNPSLTNIVVYGQQPAASTQLMTSVGELCKQIKESNPSRKIILSGPHPTSLPKRTLLEESCDYVAEGEGFNTLLWLLKNDSEDKIPGLWRRENGNLVGNLRAKNIADLTEELDDVAWDLLPPSEEYIAHNWHCLQDINSRQNYASLSTSLGCPN